MSKRRHFEEYIYLAGLTHNSAFIGWGGFEFKVKGQTDTEEWALVDDDDNEHHHPSRMGSIGAGSPAIAEEGTLAKIEVVEKETGKTITAHQGNANRFHVRDLKPDTEYSYRILVKPAGEPAFREWGAGPLRDWDVEQNKAGMRLQQDKKYINEFRTFPDPAQAVTELTFAIIGDFGRGVRKQSGGEKCQREVAAALERAVEKEGVRFILTTGDNIYHNKEGSGNEDDDWFYTYYQPYRYVINRVPVYPTVGNHDEGETERNDDRDQLYDNFFIVPRFSNLKELLDASTEPGLFYRFRYGSEIEFICLDTSRENAFEDRYFKREEHREFIDHAFRKSPAPRWRIPFSHHPPYSAGPTHKNTNSMINFLSDRFRDAGVRVVFSGHEHNFQHSIVDQINYFVTGGAGEFRSKTPSQDDFAEARTRAWGGNDEGHFLLVKIADDQMEVTPIARPGDGNSSRTLSIRDVNGGKVESKITVSL